MGKKWLLKLETEYLQIFKGRFAFHRVTKVERKFNER